MINVNEIINLIENNNIKTARIKTQQYFKDSKELYFYYMGLSFCAEGNYSKALNCFINAEKNGLKDYRLYYNIGTSYIEIKKYHTAELYLQKSLIFNQNYEECYINLAYLYYKLGDIKKSYRTIKRGMACCSGNKLKYIELNLITKL